MMGKQTEANTSVRQQGLKRKTKRNYDTSTQWNTKRPAAEQEEVRPVQVKLVRTHC